MKVEIQEAIVKRLKERVKKGDDFKSVDEYVNHILKQVVKRLDEEESDVNPTESEEMQIKERLETLGYMD